MGEGNGIRFRFPLNPAEHKGGPGVDFDGFRYPFAQYGIQQDVRAGMAVSYPDRK